MMTEKPSPYGVPRACGSYGSRSPKTRRRARAGRHLCKRGVFQPSVSTDIRLAVRHLQLNPNCGNNPFVCGPGDRKLPVLAKADPLPLYIVLPGKVIADLHQHRDGFRVARLGRGRLIGAGAKFPAIAVADDRDRHPLRRIGMQLQLGLRHLDQFGLAPDGLAHADSPSGICSAGCRAETRMSRGPAYPPTRRMLAGIGGREPVGVRSGALSRAVLSGKRSFMSRRKPSSVSTLAAILAIAANSPVEAARGLLAASKAILSASPLISGAYFSRKRAMPIASSASA